MSILNYVRKIIDTEANAIKSLSDHIGPSFEEAIELISLCAGKVVVTGVGKSGHVGKKIAASLASTGTPAFFVHSTEGVHGDLGMVQTNDLVILISNSGETTEVLSLLPTFNQLNVKKIAITSNPNSTLSKASDVSLTYTYDKEADHLGLAPTTSSTVTLVMGDALAVTLSMVRDFKKEDFHLFHPGGSIGKQLLMNDKPS